MEDTGIANDSATVTHAAAGGGYSSVSVPTLTVNVTDDTHVNSAPVITAIADITKVDGDTAFNVELTVTDTDSDDTHTYWVVSDDDAVAAAIPAQASAKTYDTTTLDTNSVTIAPVGIGTATITCNASDGTAADNDIETFEVTVAPAAPTEFTANSLGVLGSGKVELSWTASASTDVPGYKVYHKIASADDSTYTESTGVIGTTHTVSNLTNKISYDFRLAAYKTVGVEDVLSAYATDTATPVSVRFNDFTTDGPGAATQRILIRASGIPLGESFDVIVKSSDTSIATVDPAGTTTITVTDESAGQPVERTVTFLAYGGGTTTSSTYTVSYANTAPIMSDEMADVTLSACPPTGACPPDSA